MGPIWFQGGFMIKFDKVIFVCTGNTCRSPMAEAIYRHLTEDSQLPAISRGIVMLFPEPSYPKADMVLSNHNLALEGHVPRPRSCCGGQFRALSSHFSEGFISQGVIHRLIFDLLGGRAFHKKGSPLVKGMQRTIVF